MHGRLVEIPFGGRNLRLKLVNLGLPPLHFELRGGLRARQLTHLTEAQLGQLQLRHERVDLCQVRRWIDTEQYVASLEWRIGRHRDIDHLSGDLPIRSSMAVTNAAIGAD